MFKGRKMSNKPKIVYVLADDMGYGDLSGLNNNSKIHAEQLDRLASLTKP